MATPVMTTTQPICCRSAGSGSTGSGRASPVRGSFLGWALTVCRNLCRTEARKRRPEPLVRLDDHGELPDRTPGPAEQLQRQERAAALYAALERLRARERDAILLRILEGRSTAEVAQLLAVKEVSVRSLIHRGLKKLRQMDWLAEGTC